MHRTIRGIIDALITYWLFASLIFFAIRLVPGDPVLLILGDGARLEDIEAMRRQLHFDEPLSEQYVRFLRGLVTFNFGDSLRVAGVTAFHRVGASLGSTIRLSGMAVAIGSIGGILCSLAMVGSRLSRWARAVERVLIAVTSVPLLAFGPVASYVLAARFRLVPLPGDPDAPFGGLLFASVLLAIPLGAHAARIAYASLREVSDAPFLRVVRAKGGGSWRVWAVHALPASIGPILAVTGAQLGALLAGAIVLERLFEREGLGTLILGAYAARDIPVLQAAVIVGGGLFIGVQSLVVAIHPMIDPRARA